MSLVGYARVSTLDQDPALQLRALDAAGCERVYREHASGAKTDRPELAAALAFLRPGDTLCVWKLDRLGRSLQHLVSVLNDLQDKGIEFRSLSEAMDTTTSQGRLLFGIMASFAQFERDLIRERTLAGLAAARSKGRVGGRPSKMSPARMRQLRNMRADHSSITEISTVMGVSRATIYRALAAEAA